MISTIRNIFLITFFKLLIVERNRKAKGGKKAGEETIMAMSSKIAHIMELTSLN